MLINIIYFFIIKIYLIIVKIVILFENLYKFIEKKYNIYFIGEYNKILIIKNDRIKNIINLNDFKKNNINCDFFVNKILLENKYIYLLNILPNCDVYNNLICNFKFNLVEIKIDDKIYDITNLLINYYIESNKLFDDIFIKWLNIKHKINLIDKNYKIKIIDNELNYIELEKNSYIELKKNDYIQILNNC